MKFAAMIYVLPLMVLTQQAFGFFDEVGSPKAVRCSGVVLVAKEDIKGKADINDLLGNHDTVSLGDIHPNCAKYQGDVSGGCEAVIDSGNLYLRYAFNTQGGVVSIDDKITGQSTFQGWTNQYGLTKSGYVTNGVWLTNTRGGLGGNKRAFQVEFNCQAVGTDWAKK